MKPRPALTLAQRIYSTISLLGLICLCLGAFALIRMHSSGKNAEFLAQGVANQSEIISAMSHEFAETMLASRTFGLNGSAAELEKARMHIDKVSSGIKAAQVLSEAQPRLTMLAEQLPVVSKSVSEYRKLIEETAAVMARLTAARGELASAGEELGNSGGVYASEMLVSLDREIAEAAGQEKIAARRDKIGKIQELVALATTLRVRSWRAEATGTIHKYMSSSEIYPKWTS